MPAAAACNEIRKVYVVADEEIEALDEVGKDFHGGTVTTVVGPSGSGKSSLLRILACVDRPTSGSVRIRGEEVGARSARERRQLRRTEVGYVFQNPVHNLVEYLDVTEQLRFAQRVRGLRRDEDEVARLLALLRLEHRAHHLPRQLSGGEQQRLAFACAAAGRPSIVVADEPTAELDSASAGFVLETVRGLRQEGVALILCSHDPQVVEASDHLLRLEHGRAVESW